MPDSAEAGGKPRRTALQLTLTGIVTVLATVLAQMLVARLEAREPRLVYSSAETLPYEGQAESLGIYHGRVANRGRAEAQEVRCALRVAGGLIESATYSAPPGIPISQWIDRDTVWTVLPGLNPGESVGISALAIAPEGSAGDTYVLPRKAEVHVRGKGTGATEEPWQGRDLCELLRDERAWAVGIAVGLAAGVGSWVAIRRGLAGRVWDIVWERSRRHRAPDFKDDFRSWPSAWKSRSKMSVVGRSERGLRLGPITRHDLSFVLLLHREPRFADGTIEIEAFLEYGALFNVVVRGDVADDEFYMARLDSREDFWDCVLVKPKGKGWRECNKGELSHHSPFREWTTMRVDARGPRLSLYRDNQLVDQVSDAALEDGTIGLFAEGGEVHVRAMRIWRR